MSRKDNELYEFGEFRLDIAERRFENTNGGPAVPPIPEKAFQTLVHLVRNHGRLVPKQELLDIVWPDSIVEENNLDKAIHTLRAALGEKSGDQKYIETIRKHGYRFVFPVRTLSEPEQPLHRDGNGFSPLGNVQLLTKPKITASGQHVLFDIATEGTSSLEPDAIQVALAGTTPTEREPAKKALPRWIPYLAAAVLIAGVGLAAAYFYSRANAVPAGKRSLLVLPATSVGSTSNELLNIGLADSLIHHLARSTDLVVRPIGATRKYSADSVDPHTAGKEQKVEFVLASSYQVADGKTRISWRLINLGTGQVEDSSKVESGSSDVFAIQDAFAADAGKRILTTLGGTLGPIRRRGTSNEDAYRHYLQGLSMLDQRKGEQAEASFATAVELDPNYGLAWAGKALAHRNMSIGRESNSRELYDLTIEAANRALALDPTLSDAYSAMCLNKMQYEYDAVGAEPVCKRAIELDPRSATAHQSYVWVMNYQQRTEEAVAAMKTAIDLEPTSFYNQRLYANTLYLARQHEAAYAQYLRLNQLNPSVPATYEWMIRNLEALEKYDEAYEWFIRSLRAQKADDAEIEKFQRAYQLSGWSGVLREREVIMADQINYLRRAGINSRLGNKDAAFELLNKAYEQRLPLLPLIRIDAQFDPIREDPRFAELIARFGLK